jgi:hypothetical protein
MSPEILAVVDRDAHEGASVGQKADKQSAYQSP